jgi:hypothetical protein
MTGGVRDDAAAFYRIELSVENGNRLAGSEIDAGLVAEIPDAGLSLRDRDRAGQDKKNESVGVKVLQNGGVFEYAPKVPKRYPAAAFCR